MKKQMLTLFLIPLFLIVLSVSLVSATPSCATYDCSMFLWYPLGFIAIMVFMLYSFITMIARTAQADMDIIDLAKAAGIYMAFLFFYYFCSTYFDDAFMLNIMQIFMYPLGFTHLILPPIALIFTWLRKRKVE